MRLNRMIDDRRHRLAARRVDGRQVAARVIAVEGERMLEQARGRMRRWLAGQLAVLPCTVPDTVATQAGGIGVLVLAGRLGWDGPWRQLAGERLEFLLTQARRGDGFFAHAPGLVAVEADQVAMVWVLALAGRALGWHEVAAMAVDLRARMARAGMQHALPEPAQAVVAGMARWRRLGEARDVRAVLAGVEALLAGAWREEELWCLARAAEAVIGEDRLWLCP